MSTATIGGDLLQLLNIGGDLLNVHHETGNTGGDLLKSVRQEIQEGIY